MKKIRINFVDFWKSFDKRENYFYELLSSKFDIEISDEPDYLFCGTFGNSHLKYRCVKIFFTGENIYPDFNLFDYAIGFHNITFDDRYLRLPLYVFYPHAYEPARKKHLLSDEFYRSKKGFCNYVISNSLSDPARDRMIALLDGYKRVDSGGRYRNNVGGPVADKIAFAKDYRFTLCFENSSAKGYTTEKIVEAFASATIPIYWGNPQIAEEFNPKAFINCHDYSSFDDVLDRVREIEENPDLFLQMIKEPIITEDTTFSKYLTPAYTMQFLEPIFTQDLSVAKRRNTVYIGARYEQHMRTYRVIDGFFNLFRRPVYYLHNKIRSKQKAIEKKS